MQTILVVVHLFLAIGIVTLVLLQHGKGADAGAAFGSGASATVFGARGSASFLSRATGVLASLFFVTSMTLAYYATQSARPKGLMDRLAPAGQAIPDRAKVGTKIAVVPPSPKPAGGSDIPVLPPVAPSAEASRAKPLEGGQGAPPRALPKAAQLGTGGVTAPASAAAGGQALEGTVRVQAQRSTPLPVQAVTPAALPTTAAPGVSGMPGQPPIKPGG
jgi:preprotein translocase subunit SecG